jgi:hypothetical protein
MIPEEGERKRKVGSANQHLRADTAEFGRHVRRQYRAYFVRDQQRTEADTTTVWTKAKPGSRIPDLLLLHVFREVTGLNREGYT